MGNIRPTGRFQVACEVNPGVHEKLLATIEVEGVSVSSFIRRAILRELRCDMNGNAIDGDRPGEDPRVWRCWRCKSPGEFGELESNGGICSACLTAADA